MDGEVHSDTPDNATSIEVEEIVEGRLDADDVDFFRFRAEQGEFYQIDVALGTLDNSIVELYDADWSFQDANDDYGNTYASRLLLACFQFRRALRCGEGLRHRELHADGVHH